MTGSTPPERPAKKVRTTTTILVPIKMRDRLAELAAEERARTGSPVSYHDIIQRLLDKHERRRK
jgi:hypothetical protein